MNNNNNVNMDNFSVVLLNCKSLTAKLSEIKLLIYTTKPDIVCLSETWIRGTGHEPSFVNYSALWKHRGTVEVGGGLAVLIKQNVQFQEINLQQFPNGKLEVQGIRIFGARGESIGILNLYNPNENITEREMIHYKEQLGAQYMMVGDYNGHSPILDTRCRRADATGATIENVILNHNVCLLNPVNFYTYLDFRTGKRSCLDLCLASSGIVEGATMELLADVGSDHSSILITVKSKIRKSSFVARRKWKVNKENLEKFSKSIEKTSLCKPNSIDNISNDFQQRLIKAAEENIGMSSGKVVMRKATPWWTAECLLAVRRRNQARKKVERCPTRNNIVEFLQAAANCRRVCKKSKKESWKRYIQTLTYDTPTSEVWKKFRSMKNKYVANNYALVVNNIVISDPKEKANRFMEYLIENGRLNKFKKPENMENVISDSFTDNFNEDYNNEITEQELRMAMTGMKDKAPGKDNITNTLIKAIEVQGFEEILYIFNQSFLTGCMPQIWKEGIIVPILKPGKAKEEIDSYRPRTLLPCIGKLLERIIQKRLEYIVEKQNILQPCQSGFRRGLGTADVLLQYENEI